MRIIPDEPKRLANLGKHGLDLGAVTESFFETAIVEMARKGRYKALGIIDGMAVALIFQPLGKEAIAPISLRPASRKERRQIWRPQI